ncbi:Transmembrane protein 41B [Basidiobolus ranarum]|uniref:Transmembrane protein 41B n=1 Tax=Basidiobolus ranarum TaxID=34480 RepID=A0ABR2W0C6_9FUNG
MPAWVSTTYRPSPIIGLILAFLLSSMLVYYSLTLTFFSFDGDIEMKFPKNMDDVKELALALSEFMNGHYFSVLYSYIVLYIFLQAFAIPGSAMLSVLGGALFTKWPALLLVCLCSGLGATICYLISYYIASPIVERYLTERLVDWSEQIARRREHLLNYLMFLRITPILPNWFINIASPHLDVPVGVFFVATFIGVAPISFLHVQAGVAIQELSAGKEISLFNFTTILTITIAASVSLLPVIYKKKNSEDMPTMSQSERSPLLPR